MRFDGKTNKQRAKTLLLEKLSNVKRPAQGPALAHVIKSEDKGGLAKIMFEDALSEMQMTEELRQIVREYNRNEAAINRSIFGILEDDEYPDKKAAIRDSILQFVDALRTMVDNDDLFKGLDDKQATRTEGGRQFPASDYAYVPDRESPSTWKLRLTSTPGGDPDPRIVGAAVAALGEGFRGNRVQIPSNQRAAVVARVRRAWLRANPNRGRDDLPDVLKSMEVNAMELTKEELQKKIDEATAPLTAKLAKSEFMASLTDVQKTHYNGLGDEDKEAFEKMAPEQREKVAADAVKKAQENDEVLLVDGASIRKSEVGEGVFAFMKAQQAKADEAVKKAEKLEADALQKSYENRAETELPNLTGTKAEKAEMLKAIDAMPEAAREKQLEMLKAADAAMAKSFTEIGQGGGGAETEAGDKLEKMAKELAAKDSISYAKAYTQVLETPEGNKLYAQTLQ